MYTAITVQDIGKDFPLYIHDTRKVTRLSFPLLDPDAQRRPCKASILAACNFHDDYNAQPTTL